MQIKIPAKYDNIKLSNFLKNEYQLNQALICKLCRNNKIIADYKTENEIKLKHNSILRNNLEITILSKIFCNNHANKNEQDKDEQYKKNSTEKYLPKNYADLIKKSKIFENENIIAINKPYGLSVQGGSGIKYCLEDFFKILSDKKLYIVHRIDKETSGVLVLAKNKESARNITTLFAEKKIEKKYIAIVSPIPKIKSDTIKTKILEHVNVSKSNTLNQNIQNISEVIDINDNRFKNAKIAITHYNVISIDEKNNTATLEMIPITGKKHQLRVHAKYINCPIIGDFRYGGNMKLSNKLKLFATEIKIPNIDLIKLEIKL